VRKALLRGDIILIAIMVYASWVNDSYEMWLCASDGVFEATCLIDEYIDTPVE
jgi:hypothetical protein